jgi:acetyl esterase/lipase
VEWSAITADYRVESRQGVKPTQRLADVARSRRFVGVRSHAGQLGIDPQRIAAGADLAGGTSWRWPTAFIRDSR